MEVAWVWIAVGVALLALEVMSLMSRFTQVMRLHYLEEQVWKLKRRVKRLESLDDKDTGGP